MEIVNFPIVALGAALICLIGITIYAITQRSSIRSRDEQLVVARAQAYAMLELSQAGVLFLDREHRLMGEASSAAPELLGHTCAAGTAFVQAIADLVDVKLRRDTVAYLETLWKAEPSAMVDATLNPLARLHSGSRHLAIRFARLVVDGRVHHIIVSIERIAAPRIMPHTIEVPALNEDTFAKRLAGETGTRPALSAAAIATLSAAPIEAGVPEQAMPGAEPPKPAPVIAPDAAVTSKDTPAVAPAAAPRQSDRSGPFDVTADSLPPVTSEALAPFAPPPAFQTPPAPPAESAASRTATNEVFVMSLPPEIAAGSPEIAQHLATTITSPQDAHAASQPPAQPDPASIIDPPDPRMAEVLKEVMHVEAGRLENFLGEARDKAGQLRAIIKLPARDPQAFREKLVLILEMIRGIHARAQRLPLPSVCERAARFEDSLSKLRDQQILSGNDFLPIAVKLDDLLSHLAIQGEVVTRLRDWRTQNGVSGPPAVEATQRSATLTGTTIRQPKIRNPAGDVDHARRRDFRDATRQAALRSLPGKPGGNGAVSRRHVRQARVAGVCRAGRRAGTLPAHGREDPRPAHPQRHSPRRRSAHRSRREGQAGDRHGRRAVPALRRRRISAQRAGRWPRPRPRQDSRRGRAPGRAQHR